MFSDNFLITESKGEFMNNKTSVESVKLGRTSELSMSLSIKIGNILAHA